jgi:hypothetical protein
MARSGDLAGAKQEVQALQELRTALDISFAFSNRFG